MSRAEKLVKHYTRIGALWPKDPVRPQQHFSKALAFRDARLASLPESTAQAEEARELRAVNALYSLLDDRYMKKYPLPSHVAAPASNPSHYTDLVAEIEAAPHRTWMQNWLANMKSRVRFS